MPNQRWCFQHDDDGHVFMIPVEQRDKFVEVLEDAYEADDFDEFENDFGQYMLDTGECYFSFIDPQPIVEQ